MRRRKPRTRWRTTRRPREGEAWPRRAAPGLPLEAGRGRSAAPVLMPTTKIAPSPPSARRRRGGAQGTCAWSGHRCPLARARFRRRPAHSGRGAWGYAPTSCDRLRPCVPSSTLAASSAHHEERATDTPHGLAMELPRHASSRWPHAAAKAFPPVVGVLALSASGRKPVKPIRGDAESATAPFGAVRPLRPCLVVNPGGCMAVPRASWPQPSGANNFPSATRIPRAANSLRLPVLHCVSAASGATRPTPADRITTRTRWARPC